MNERRYVILEHSWNGIHYDLMLEENSALKTWRLSEMLKPGLQIGEAMADHRSEYLDYEGPIAGDRGEVKRIASGTYLVTELEPNKRVLSFCGSIAGRLEIVEQDKTSHLIWMPTN